jgi:YbgC/YbaW family acyl-CoA thioester hydrolase
VQEKRIQTRWTDFDALSHITHAAYPVYLDEARDSYLASTVGSFTDWPCVVAHVSIDYRKEIRYPAPEVLVRTRVSEVGRTSVTFEQEVLDPDGEVSATARSVMVAWDPDTREPREISETERTELAADSA